MQTFLHKHGGAVHLLGLEGFLFEGTAAKLLRYVLETAERSPELRFVILDLKLVQGVDPSASELLGRLSRQLLYRQTRLVFANLQPSLVPMCLQHAGIRDGDTAQANTSVWARVRMLASESDVCGGRVHVSSVGRKLRKRLGMHNIALLVLKVRFSPVRGPGKYSPQWTARSNGAKTSCCCRVLPKVEHLIRQAREGRRPPWRREEVVLTLGHPLQSYVLTGKAWHERVSGVPPAPPPLHVGVTPASERCRSPRRHCPVTWRGHGFSPLARLNRSGQANFSQYKAKSIMSSF